jgi:hypothetical protein
LDGSIEFNEFVEILVVKNFVESLDVKGKEEL